MLGSLQIAVLARDPYPFKVPRPRIVQVPGSSPGWGANDQSPGRWKTTPGNLAIAPQLKREDRPWIAGTAS